MTGKESRELGEKQSRFLTRREFLGMAAAAGVGVIAAGCSQAAPPPPTAAPKPAAAPAAQGASQSVIQGLEKYEAQSGSGKLVVFNNKGVSFYFFVIQAEAVKRAVEGRGWTFETTNANFDGTLQNQQWTNSLVKKPAAIISDPIDSEAIISVIKASNDAKVPVAIVDTPATGGNVPITVDFDNYQGGVMSAQKIVELLTKKYGSPKGKVLNCYGALSSSAWAARREGFNAEMKKYPDIMLLDRPTEGQQDKMASVTTDTLSQYPDLDAAHAPSDTPATGIIAAMSNRGKLKKVGEEGHIIFVTIDGEPRAIQWLKDGILDASVSQDPIAYGEIAVELLDRFAMQGKEVPLGTYTNKKYIWETAAVRQDVTGPRLLLEPFYIDKTNMDDPRHWGNVAFKTWGIKFE